VIRQLVKRLNAENILQELVVNRASDPHVNILTIVENVNAVSVDALRAEMQFRWYANLNIRIHNYFLFLHVKNKQMQKSINLIAKKTH
jgi:hypothetical protein